MHADNLVRMANRIGEFFQSMPDRDDASREIALHLKKFWEPRMRRALLAHLDTEGGAGLLPIVRDAVTAQRGTLEAPPRHGGSVDSGSIGSSSVGNRSVDSSSIDSSAFPALSAVKALPGLQGLPGLPASPALPPRSP